MTLLALMILFCDHGELEKDPGLLEAAQRKLILEGTDKLSSINDIVPWVYSKDMIEQYEDLMRYCLKMITKDAQTKQNAHQKILTRSPEQVAIYEYIAHLRRLNHIANPTFEKANTDFKELHPTMLKISQDVVKQKINTSGITPGGLSSFAHWYIENIRPQV